MATYKNPFYNPRYQDSRKVIETPNALEEYKGYFIYERIKGVCFDIVKNGICVHMNAGINGAKKRIDFITSSNH